MRAREEDRRTALLAPHDRLAAAEIRNDVAVFHPLDNAVDDVADAVLEFLILAIALGLPHFLYDHLLGRLGGNASILKRRQWFGNVVAHPGGRIAPPCILYADLDRIVFNLIGDKEQ